MSLLLRFVKMIFMLFPNKNLSKLQIFHHYTIDAFKFSLLWLILVVHATNVISEPFPWLLLHRLHENLSSFAVHESGCMQKSTFFIKVRLFSKLLIQILTKMFFQETFDINHYYYHYWYCTFIDRRQKKNFT